MHIGIFIQEYEELANKIHELQTRLQAKEQELTEYETEEPEPPPEVEPLSAPAPPPISLPSTEIGNGSRSTEEYQALPSPIPPLKSPLRHVKAFLPNEQHTSVSFNDKSSFLCKYKEFYTVHKY